MTGGFDIAPARSARDLAAISQLFADYARSLPVDLDYQDFAAELAGLPGKYAQPEGELLLARDADGVAAGCVGLRPLLAKRTCEMKRLYLAPTARGQGLGRALAQAIVQAARRRRYAELKLDTLPSMTTALALYEDLGFRRIAPYYAPTPPGTVFLGLRL